MIWWWYWCAWRRPIETLQYYQELTHIVAQIVANTLRTSYYINKTIKNRCDWKFTFRTSSKEADTPGLVGIISSDPNTLGKLGEWDTLPSLDVDEQPDKDVVNSDDIFTLETLAFDAFLANDLKAAAKDDACGSWLVSDNFNDDELFATTALVGMGVSQILEWEICPLIEGMSSAGEEPFIREGAVNEGIFGWSFVEFTQVGNPVIETVHIHECRGKYLISK